MRIDLKAARPVLLPVIVCALNADEPAELAAKLSGPSPSHSIQMQTEPAGLTRSDKLLLTNAAAGGALILWGVTQWDYFTETFHMKKEGWFGNDTDSGGADKLGHLYSAYVITRVLAPLYDGWGYSRDESALYAAASSVFLTVGVIELGDGTSHYGFSYEDAVMDTAGAVIGYFWYRYPFLAERIDLRVEWIPDFGKSDQGTDFTTDYENMKHLIAVKAEGFETFKETFMQYFELHLGYYGRNFHENGAPGSAHPIPPEETERYVYVGVGLNLSRLLRPAMGDYTAFFNYYQVPYTYISYDREID